VIVPRRDESSRLETFSDAMIAFASTLLVVSLEVPKSYDELVANLRGFIPFALTFAALMLIWVAHKNFFRRYPIDDPITVVLNGVLLFTILFYAFPLKFLAGSFVSIFMPGSHVILTGPGQLRNLFMIYAVGWMLVFSCIALLYRHVARSPGGLTLSTLESYDAITHSRYYLAFVLAGAISFAIAALDIGVRFGLPGLAYSLIGVFTSVNGSRRRKDRAKLEAAVATHPQLADTAGIPTPPKPSKSAT
jgi:uncharacterized membrane protein